MLDDLERAFGPSKRCLIDKLRQIKRQHTENAPDQLYLWDKPFYHRMDLEQNRSYHQKPYMQYFSFDHCTQKLMETFEHMFSIRIKPFAPGFDEIWHESVRMHSGWDAHEGIDSFLGWFYFGPFPRKDKYPHFGHYGLQPVSST